MSNKTYTVLKENFLFEMDFVTNIGSKMFIYPFIGRSKVSILCFIAICAFLFITIVQLAITLIVSKFENWFEIINIAPNVGVCVIILIKYTKMHTNQKVYDDVLKHFRNDVWDVIKPESKEHNVILETYTNTSRLITRFEYYYTIVLISIVLLSPRILMMYDTKILGNDIYYLYPYDGWYPFDKVKWYNTVYIWESLMTTIVIVLFVFANMIHLSFTRNICMELKILGSSIEGLITPKDVKNIKKGYCISQTHERIKNRLKTIIKRHQLLASMVADLDNVFGLGMLLIYIFGSVFICLTILTALFVDNLYMSMRYFSFFCSLLVEVFLQCIIGQLLFDHSEGLVQAIYFSDWPYADQDTKRMLYIFLIRAQRPLKFSAKGYLTMDLKTFGGICSLSYQFFNLLRQAYL